MIRVSRGSIVVTESFCCKNGIISQQPLKCKKLEWRTHFVLNPLLNCIIFRRLLIAHQKLKEGSLKKHEDKSSMKTDLAFECKLFSSVLIYIFHVNLSHSFKHTPSGDHCFPYLHRLPCPELSDRSRNMARTVFLSLICCPTFNLHLNWKRRLSRLGNRFQPK